MGQGIKKDCKSRANSPTYSFQQLIQHVQVAIGATSPDMTTVFNTRLYGRFIEMGATSEERNFIVHIKAPMLLEF